MLLRIKGIFFQSLFFQWLCKDNQLQKLDIHILVVHGKVAILSQKLYLTLQDKDNIFRLYIKVYNQNRYKLYNFTNYFKKDISNVVSKCLNLPEFINSPQVFII